MLNNAQVHEINRPLLLYTACIADTILQPLYHFSKRRHLFGYVDILHEIARWAIEFHNDYHNQLADWDEFEESELNIYNASTWDEFLIYWANDRLKQFKAQYGTARDPLMSNNQQHGARETKLMVVIKDGKLSAVYSNALIQYAHLVCDNSEIPFRLIGFYAADTQADLLHTLFDSQDPNQSTVRELLRTHGF